MKRDQPEWGLSHWVDVFMDRAFLTQGPCWYTAIEGGTWMVSQSPEARMNAEQKRRARGVKPHHLDWYCWQRSTGLYAQWELKVDDNEPTSGQRDTIAALKRDKIPTTTCWTVPEVFKFLSGAGFELHANAANIAAELHERYLAKRRAAGTPKKPSRVRKTTKTTFSVAQGHKAGAWK